MECSDLKFSPHSNGYGNQAVVEFENGYGASIVTGSSFYYTSKSSPYELAVLKGGALCYDTPVTDDVLGHLTSSDVSETLAKIEALPSA